MVVNNAIFEYFWCGSCHQTHGGFRPNLRFSGFEDVSRFRSSGLETLAVLLKRQTYLGAKADLRKGGVFKHHHNLFFFREMRQFSGFLLSSGKIWRIIRHSITVILFGAGCFVSMTGMVFWQQTKAGATYGRVWILKFGLDLKKSPTCLDDTAAHIECTEKTPFQKTRGFFEKGPVHALCWCST